MELKVVECEVRLGEVRCLNCTFMELKDELVTRYNLQGFARLNCTFMELKESQGLEYMGTGWP